MNMLMNHDGSDVVFDQDILEHPQNYTCDNNEKLKETLNLKETHIAGHKFMVGNVGALCTNPPFGNDITRTERHVLDQYDLGRERMSQIVEILFIERCVQLLKPGNGRAAIIIPQSILNNPSLDYVRKWILNHTKILAVIELPVETFLISGREGTGTLTAILVVQRRELDETVALLNGQEIEPYPIFMAIANKVGYDRRGKTLYRREKDGTDIVVDRVIEDPTTKKVMRITKERIVANDLPHILEDYIDFRKKLKKGAIYFDKAEGVYRAIA